MVYRTIGRHFTCFMSLLWRFRPVHTGTNLGVYAKVFFYTPTVSSPCGQPPTFSWHDYFTHSIAHLSCIHRSSQNINSGLQSCVRAAKDTCSVISFSLFGGFPWQLYSATYRLQCLQLFSVVPCLCGYVLKQSRLYRIWFQNETDVIIFISVWTRPYFVSCQRIAQYWVFAYIR